MDPSSIPLPAGFQPSANPTFGQNPTTGAVAHFDPITNAWSTSQPPTDFVPDPSAPGPLTYVNPATGQQLQYTGYDTWAAPGDSAPPVFHYDPASGRTAYRDARTGTWTVPTPPDGFHVDPSQPPSRLGFFFTDGRGTTTFFDSSGPGWTDADSYKPLHISSQERPEPGVRVEVPENLPPVLPDTPDQAKIHNDIWLKRVNALRQGDLTVPSGTPARDFVADQKNLDASIALREEMIKAGDTDLTIIDNHIADLQRYIVRWNDYRTPDGKFVHGGATAVNDAAQQDDLASGLRQTGTIFDMGEGIAGGELVTQVGRFIEARGIGGGGSQTVVPKARTAEEFITRQRRVGPLAGGSAAEELPPPQMPSGPGEAPTSGGGAGAGVPIPPTNPGAGHGPAPEIERPSAGMEPGSPRALEVEVPSGEAPSGPPADALTGASDADIVQAVVENEAHHRDVAADILLRGDPDLVDLGPNESRDDAIARFGHQHSLDGTHLDPSSAAIRLKALRGELGDVIAGRSETVQRTPENVRRLAVEYRAVQQNVEHGMAIFEDYWDRVPPEIRGLLRQELDLASGKDPAFWQDLFGDTTAIPYARPSGDPALGALVDAVDSWLRVGRFQNVPPPRAAVPPRPSSGSLTADLPAVDPKASTGALPDGIPPTNPLPQVIPPTNTLPEGIPPTRPLPAAIPPTDMHPPISSQPATRFGDEPRLGSPGLSRLFENLKKPMGAGLLAGLTALGGVGGGTVLGGGPGGAPTSTPAFPSSVAPGGSLGAGGTLGAGGSLGAGVGAHGSAPAGSEAPATAPASPAPTAAPSPLSGSSSPIAVCDINAQGAAALVPTPALPRTTFTSENGIGQALVFCTYNFRQPDGHGVDIGQKSRLVEVDVTIAGPANAAQFFGQWSQGSATADATGSSFSGDHGVGVLERDVAATAGANATCDLLKHAPCLAQVNAILMAFVRAALANHPIQSGGSTVEASPGPSPSGGTAGLDVSPISAVEDETEHQTTYFVTVTGASGTTSYRWTLQSPAGNATCNKWNTVPTDPRSAIWHHGDADGCDHSGLGPTGHAGTITVTISDSTGRTCTASYQGTVSGTGPAVSCGTGGPGSGSSGPGASGAAPSSLPVAGGPAGGGGTSIPSTPAVATGGSPIVGAVLGALLAAAIALGVLSFVPIGAPAGGGAAPIPVPARGRKGKMPRDCRKEAEALSKADTQLQKARAAATAAADATASAQSAQASAKAAQEAAQGLLESVKSGGTVTVGDGPRSAIRTIVRQKSASGGFTDPTAADVKNVETSHRMTIDEGQRRLDEANAALADAEAELATAKAAQAKADAAAGSALAAYEAADRDYSACMASRQG